jgi:Holliday junction resolvasome RuvABC ATP-dependent DNA helicase subunit
MPGLERRLARYPQLYSRIGFAHQYRPLAAPDLAAVLAAYWQLLGHTLHPDSPADADAIAAVARITGGNFRLIERLLGQVRRVLDINDLDTITADVIDTARGALVIGT